jgi:hypothetical protein
VSAADEQVLRSRLREELGTLRVRPAPVTAVTSRGRAVRARRRVVAAALTAAAAAAAAVLVAVPGVLPASLRGVPPVTVNAPDPAAPGGVFASGTAAGRRWQLAVANIATGGRCLPAVMLNGHAGDVLYRAPGQVIGNPAFLLRAFTGFGFFQVTQAVTRAAVVIPGGTVSLRPVAVPSCGGPVRLVGFAFPHPRRGVTAIKAYDAAGHAQTLAPPATTFASIPVAPPAPRPSRAIPSGSAEAGVWQNLDTARPDVLASLRTTLIARSPGHTLSWAITMSLGLYGQCYQGTAGPAGHQTGIAGLGRCAPVEEPPAGIMLTEVPFPAGVHVTGYAGLASPRTAYATALLSDGTTRTMDAVTVTGRTYLGLAVARPARLLRLWLYDAAGTPFARWPALGHTP